MTYKPYRKTASGIEEIKFPISVLDGSSGQNGQVLTSHGSTSAPTWETPSGGGSGNVVVYCSSNISTTIEGTIALYIGAFIPNDSLAVNNVVISKNGYLGVISAITPAGTSITVTTKASLKGADGAPGQNGLNGNNIIYSTVGLQPSGTSQISIGNFIPQVEFKVDNLVVSANGYLGRVTNVTSTYLSVTTLTSIKGQDGTNGADGADGADGLGFKSITASSNVFSLAYGCYIQQATSSITITVGTSSFVLYPNEIMFVYRSSSTSYKYFWTFQSNTATNPYSRNGYATSTTSGTVRIAPSTLSLNGTANSSNPSFYAPTSAGTSGYLLKSNGSGAPTWVTNGLAYTPSRTELAKNTSTTSLTATTAATTKTGYALVDITFGVMLYATSGKYASAYVQNSSSTVIWGTTSSPTTTDYMISVSGYSRSNVAFFTVTVPADGTNVTIGAKTDSSAELHLYLWCKQYHN